LILSIDWSEVIREAVKWKIKEEGGMNIAEAVLLNERLRKKAPKGLDSARVIKAWRARRFSNPKTRSGCDDIFLNKI